MMITCNECLQRMYPSDPRVKSGRYHLCSCDYCTKPQYYRDLELSNKTVNVTRNVTYLHPEYIKGQIEAGKKLQALKRTQYTEIE